MTKTAIAKLWDAIQEDGENLDFETFDERITDFLSSYEAEAKELRKMIWILDDELESCGMGSPFTEEQLKLLGEKIK